MGLNDQELRMYEKWLDEANDKVEQLEQRYQQLEQVAYRLFVEFLYYSRNVAEIESYREQLEALGVSLDD